MSPRSLVIVRKTMSDFSNPVLLLGFLVPYLAVAYFLGMGLTNGLPEDLASLPLYLQEQSLIQALVPIAYVWALGIPMLVLVTVLAANAIAREAQTGTLHILLSKPIRRWEVLVGKFVAVFVFSLLAMVTGLLLAGTLVYVHSGASAAAIAGSVGALLPGSLAYALFVSFSMGAFATFVSTATGTRLRTLLGSLVAPALFVAFMFVRLFPTSDIYEDYFLYLVDVGYHFGNAFVFLHQVMGVEFTPPTQLRLDTIAGSYDTTGASVDPLVGGMPSDVPYAGYVAPSLSTALILLASVGLLAAAIYRFERSDVD